MKTLMIAGILLIATHAAEAKTPPAPKCFKSETSNDLMETFPFVAQATVEERVLDGKSKTNFKIKFRLDKVLKGETKQTHIEAVESHASEAMTEYHFYKTGDTFIVAGEPLQKPKPPKKKKKNAPQEPPPNPVGPYKIILPADSCAPLPREIAPEPTPAPEQQ